MVTRHDAVLAVIPALAGVGFLADRVAGAARVVGVPLPLVGLLAALVVIGREVVFPPGL